MDFINNVDRRLADDLKDKIKSKSKVAIAASSFSIYAFDALRKELSNVEELRFIYTSPVFMNDSLKKDIPQFFIPHLYKEADLCGGEFELRLRNRLTQRAIAHECSRWVKEKVRFKSNKLHDAPIGGMIVADNKDKNQYSWNNINGFTTADLGITQRNDLPVLIQRSEYPTSQNFLNYFNNIWNNNDILEDVTDKVLHYFEKAFRENSPEYIYFITLYNIFKDFLDDLNQDNLPNEKVGFKDTVIWSMLYNFQKDAVVGAINKLEQYGGCILADSVGLGKTFSALGVIKYYEMRNKNVLILCPKKLEDNWNTYRSNYKNNLLVNDRFRYDVLFHTDLTRKGGMSNGINLSNINLGNYDLVVIDESHNFRNAGRRTKGKENRYERLLNSVIKEGVKTKVLMLSATPVNNRFNDLKNQLALAYEDDEDLINEKLNITKGIDDVFKQAQTAFNEWSQQGIYDRTTTNLIDKLPYDFFEILDALTIARSRKHITTYYDTSAIGQFPVRNKPVSINASLTADKSLTYKEIADYLSEMNLSIYSPLSYLLPGKDKVYAKLYDSDTEGGFFTQVDRQSSLKVLMRINMLKRLESSVDSFRKTLKNIHDYIERTLEQLRNGDIDNMQGLQIENVSDENFDWESEWGDEESLIGKKVKVHLADVDPISWSEDLEEDLTLFRHILQRLKEITPEKDNKLQSLIQLIEEKQQNPINANNKKVIVFTAFSDTADYLYDNLSKHFKEKHGLNSTLITGSHKASTSNNLPKDLNGLLTCFSPISKNKAQLYPEITEDLDILIATDCISEGQNLQDCDYLVNYDIHWNPVRIIQRFGRIDRIGSINDSITLVNFWPDITLDQYINLKQRVEDRMLISVLTGTTHDNLLNEKQEDLEYRKVQLKRLQEDVSDMEDLHEGVDITDLGLNDFRIDLSNFFKTYGALSSIPSGLHAVVPATEKLQPGVLFVLKNVNDKVNINKLNRLHPYYLLYVDNEGGLVFNHLDSKKSLDAMRLLCKGRTEAVQELCDVISSQTDDYHNMDKYSELLKKGIGSILNVEEQKRTRTLFNRGGTATSDGRFKGIEDFELVSFLIVS